LSTQPADRRVVRRLLAAVALMPMLLLGACQGSNHGTGSPSPAQDPVDRSHITELDARVTAAVLPASALPESTRTPVESDRVGYQLLPQCQQALPTDGRIVTDGGGAWSSNGAMPLIDQWVLAYDRPVATAAVTEAAGALSCKGGASRNGATVTSDGTFAVDGSPGALAYCDKIKGTKEAARCTVVLAVSDLTCSVRAWAETRDAAKALVSGLVPAVQERCR
jgi:hypothetical protein